MWPLVVKASHSNISDWAGDNKWKIGNLLEFIIIMNSRRHSLSEDAPVIVVMWYLGHWLQLELPTASAYVSSGQRSHTGTFSLKPIPFTIRELSVSDEKCPCSQLTMERVKVTTHCKDGGS